MVIISAVIIGMTIFLFMYVIIQKDWGKWNIAFKGVGTFKFKIRMSLWYPYLIIGTAMNIEKQYDVDGLVRGYVDGSLENEQNDLGRQFLRERVDIFDRSSSLLDIGCGNGMDLKVYAGMGFTHLYGVDPSENFLQEARELLNGKIKLSEGVFEQLPFENEMFDVVVSRHALHYSHNLTRAAIEVARVLKSGGAFIVVISHPFADALLPRDEEGNVTATLFNGAVSIIFPQHALSDLFSASFLDLFELDLLYEYVGNERDGAVAEIPNTVAFIAIKK